MKGKIFINDWIRLKPYNKQKPSDLYYLKIANEVKKTFIKSGGLTLNHLINNENLVNSFSCFLTSYFEDVISKSGIWGAFISLHNKMYGKILPFYPTEDYLEDEINEVDVKFLIWYFVNSIQSETFVFPNSKAIEDFSGLIMEIFEREFEYAPENENLKIHYTLDLVDNDYYLVRHLIDRILFKTYLFFPDTAMQLEEQELDIIKKEKGKLTIRYLNDNRDFFLHKSHTALLGIKGKDWLAEIFGKEHELYQDLLDISPRVAGNFLYKGQDENDILLEHIASGKKFQMTKKSFEHTDELRKIDTIIYAGLVRWQNEWWFSGVISIRPYDAEFVENQKKSMGSRKQVDFLDFGNEKITEMLQDQTEAFLKFNNGSLIAFMPTSEFDNFSRAFIDYYNDSLNFTDKEIEESNKRADKADVGKNKVEQIEMFSDMEEPGLVFFNPKSGLEMAWGVTDAFPLSHNPWIDEDEVEDSMMTLLTSQDLSRELAMYSIEHFKKDIQFFQEKNGKSIVEDLDFLMRFFKKEHYHTQPAISLVGG